VFLTKLDVSATTYRDFKALIKEEYEYYLFGQGESEISSPLVSNNIQPDYYGWFIIDEENSIAYKFDTNMSSDALTPDEDFTEYQTNAKYNAFSRGKRNAIRGSIRAIMGNIESNNIDQSNSLLSQFRDFIVSDRPKLLKDRKGRIYRIFSYGYSEQQLNDNIQEQVIVSSFSFVELGEVYE
jgi:hypothetical protein